MITCLIRINMMVTTSVGLFGEKVVDIYTNLV